MSPALIPERNIKENSDRQENLFGEKKTDKETRSVRVYEFYENFIMFLIKIPLNHAGQQKVRMKTFSSPRSSQMLPQDAKRIEAFGCGCGYTLSLLLCTERHEIQK